MPVVDSHCHLADDVFDEDLEEVVGRARAAGVGRGLCVLAAGNATEAVRADRLASIWPEIRFAVGVHPHEAGHFADDREAAVETVRAAIAANPRVRALGEIGLDYHYDFSPRSVQQELFSDQVELARELGLPVVIHTREATADTLAILREAGRGEVTGVFHCFSGDAGMARDALDLGFAVSFAGIVTFPRADALRAAAALVPPDRLLVETDAPYLAPVPHRGSRNEPAHVIEVAAAVARARGESFEAVAHAAMATFEALFAP